MALISERDKTYLRDRFQKELQDEVKIVYFTQRELPLFVPGQECHYCRETREILEEVSSLSEKLHLEVHDFVADGEVVQKYRIDKIPATVLAGAADYGVRYYGIPSGYEFSTLIESLIDVSRGASALSQETREELRKLDRDVHIQVFVTPT